MPVHQGEVVEEVRVTVEEMVPIFLVGLELVVVVMVVVVAAALIITQAPMPDKVLGVELMVPLVVERVAEGLHRSQAGLEDRESSPCTSEETPLYNEGGILC